MLFPEQPPIVDRATLLPLAQAATDCPNLQIDTWQTTLVSQQGGAALSASPEPARSAARHERGRSSSK